MDAAETMRAVLTCLVLLRLCVNSVMNRPLAGLQFSLAYVVEVYWSKTREASAYLRTSVVPPLRLGLKKICSARLITII